MIIALTGTPGTGKTSICNYLEQVFEVIHLNGLIKEEHLYTGVDEQRDCFIADLDAVQQRLDELVMGKTGTIIIEGHLSHYLKGTGAVIVLRTQPLVLKQRLASRGYRPGKIQENFEAEALDVILIEAVEENEMVYELETTDLTPEEAGVEVEKMIRSLEAGDYEQLKYYLPGRFDWNQEIFL